MTMKGACLLLLCLVVVQARNVPESRNPQPRAWEKGKVPASVYKPPPGKTPQSSGSNAPNVGNKPSSPGKIPQSSGSNAPKVGPTKTFYHYTDQAGYDGIKNSHIIKTTSEENGLFGKGVYLTTKDPSEGKQAVAEAGWNNGANSIVGRGKVDYVFKVHIPENDKNLERCKTGRDVWVYRDPLKESSFPWQVARVPNNKGGKVTWGSKA